MDIVWEDLTIDVGDKHVVRRMSGTARSGRMIAVMGPTGSGKTTLLTNLAARGAGTYKIGGTVRYGGHEWTKALKRRTGFVEQEDLASAELTVRQNLNVAAQLRLPQHLLGRASAESGQASTNGWLLINQRLQRVEEVIKMLHLEKCADTVVGSAGARGVSGGEKKRLCIGMEMLTEPSFLFFDEPTSGLDSSHALLVARCMRDLCRSGVTVISSIHQPSSQIYELFDDLLLLDEGNVAYFGPTADAVPFFKSLGFACPVSWNPADFFMDLLVLEENQVKLREKLGYTVPKPGKQHVQSDTTATAASGVLTVSVELTGGERFALRLSEGRARLRDAKQALFGAAGFAPMHIELCDEGHSPLTDDSLPLTDGQKLWLDETKHAEARLSYKNPDGKTNSSGLDAPVSNAVADRYTAPFKLQLRVLVERVFIVQSDQQWSWMNFSLYSLLSVITGLFWWRTGYEEKDIFLRMSLVFWFVGTWSFFPLFNSLMTFVADMTMVCAINSQAASALAAYFMGRINDDLGVFMLIFAATNLTLLTFQSISLVISAGVAMHRLFIVCILLISTLFSSAGLFIPIRELPGFLRWMRHVNPMKYSNDLVMHLYLSGDETYSCATDGTSSFSKCNALNFTDVLPDSGDASISQQEVLEHFDVEKGPWACAAFLAAISVFCRVLAYRLLRAQTNGFEGCDCAVPMPCGSKDDEGDTGSGEEENEDREELVP